MILFIIVAFIVVLILLIVLFQFRDNYCVSLKDCQCKEKKFGINVAGFDQGDGGDTDYACIADIQIDWLQKGEMDLLRMPIMPKRIFPQKPTTQTTFSDKIFNSRTFVQNQIKCNACSGYYPNAPFMNAVNYALSRGMSVIIDLHDNDKHLDHYGSTITPDEFTNMWRLLATFLKKNISKEKIRFMYLELFNEPLGNITDKDGNQINDDNKKIKSWNVNYVASAVKAIRGIDQDFNVIVTTWGDWSGFHSWGDDPHKTLIPLLESLKGLIDDHLYLATHQYCDYDYSGRASDCTKDFMNNWKGWIDMLDPVFKKYGIQVILTEGNPLCPKNNSCNHGSYFIDFIKSMYQKEWFIGATVWMSNTGADYQGTNMGNGCNKRQFDNYDFYLKTTGTFPDQYFRLKTQFSD